MTPPRHATATARPLLRDGPVAEASRGPLTPAPRPQAVLVPPLLLGTVGALATVLAAAHGSEATGMALGGPPLLLFLAAVLPNALILTWARAHGVKAAVLVAPGIAAALSGLAAWALGGVPLLVFGVACVTGLLAPVLWRPWQAHWMTQRVEKVSLVAPTTLGAFEAICRLEAVPWVKVTSAIVPEADPDTATRLLKRPVHATPRDGMRLERRVIVSCPVRDPAVGRTIAELVARGHDLTSESATLRSAEGRVDTSRADPLNLLLGRRRSRFHDAASRILDILLALALLSLAAPFLLFSALAVLLDSGFPIFYRQRRVGQCGRPIHVIKFRSMRVDAEELSGPVWATESDPRITRVGRVLRRYRLDELPQLWNVLWGDMALVGPRPERPHFCKVLREQVPLFELRTIVRPGVTGWAQVRLAYGASTDDARAKLEYDLYYVMHRSPWFDLAVMAETVCVVLTGQGAR